MAAAPKKAKKQKESETKEPKDEALGPPSEESEAQDSKELTESAPEPEARSFEQDFLRKEKTNVEPETNQYESGSLQPQNLSGKAPSGAKTAIWIALIVVVLGALIGGGVYFYKMRGASPQEELLEQTEESVTPTPTTPTENLDLSEYNVQVLNGSGTAGEAGKVKAALEKAGFEDFEVGNAQTYDYTDTEVRVMSDTPTKVYAAIKDALEEAGYSVKKGSALSSTSDFDVVVTVGSKKVGGVKTAATPTPTKKPATGSATPTPTKATTPTPTPTKSVTPTPTPTKTP